MPKGLVLTRKEGEVIMIGEDVKITVLEITPVQVRLQVVAPKELPIARAGGRPAKETHVPSDIYVDLERQEAFEDEEDDDGD